MHVGSSDLILRGPYAYLSCVITNNLGQIKNIIFIVVLYDSQTDGSAKVPQN
jgi:hypothetical protein